MSMSKFQRVRKSPSRITSAVKTKTFAFEPMALMFTLIGFIMGLIPKLQSVAWTVPGYLLPTSLYATVIDHLWGDSDGEESALWTFLMASKPADISQQVHLATQDLTEGVGRLSADLAVNISTVVREGKDDGTPVTEVMHQIRNLIDEALDEHNIEADVQAVLDAK